MGHGSSISKSFSHNTVDVGRGTQLRSRKTSKTLPGSGSGRKSFPVLRSGLSGKMNILRGGRSRERIGGARQDCCRERKVCNGSGTRRWKKDWSPFIKLQGRCVGSMEKIFLKCVTLLSHDFCQLVKLVLVDSPSHSLMI